MCWLRNLFIYPEERFWCGSWIFYIKQEKLFFEACKKHDIDYKEKVKTRKQADLDFLQNMLLAARLEPNYEWHKFRALLYYSIVRIFWGFYF